MSALSLCVRERIDLMLMALSSTKWLSKALVGVHMRTVNRLHCMQSTALHEDLECRSLLDLAIPYAWIDSEMPNRL